MTEEKPKRIYPKYEIPSYERRSLTRNQDRETNIATLYGRADALQQYRELVRIRKIKEVASPIEPEIYHHIKKQEK